jgi:RimJ/RimL family protein N-acetyltransferase
MSLKNEYLGMIYGECGSKLHQNEMPLKFVDYDRRFLLASRRWLRDPEIAALTMTPDFTDEAQERWFTSLPAKVDYSVWGIELDGEPVGVIGLKNITDEQAEYFGYLGEKQLWGRGYGKQMLEAAFENARARGCTRVYLRVWRENRRAVALYNRFGFEKVREEGTELFMDRHV